MRSVKSTWRVLNSWLSGRGIWVDSPCISVASDGDKAIGVAEFQCLHFEIETRAPVYKCEEPGWEHACRFEFGTVAMAIQILEGGTDCCQDSAFI